MMNTFTFSAFMSQSRQPLLAVFTILLLVCTLPGYAENSNTNGYPEIKNTPAGVQQKHVAIPGSSINHTPSFLTKSSASSGGNGKSYMLQLFSGLVLVLLIIVVLAWIVKRFNRLQPSSSCSLQVIGGISMGSRERVVIVQAGATKILLGVSPGRINMLHVLEENISTTQQESKNISDDLTIADADTDKTRTFSQNLAAALFRKKS